MDVFISYKSEEFAIADNVREQLEAQGISCWMAPMSISGGASYASEIPKAIRSCNVFVLILSDAAQHSQWVSRELDQAINHQKQIMPFKVDNSELQDEFRFYLANVQWYDAAKDRERAFQKLCKDIRAMLPKEEAVCEEPAAAPMPMAVEQPAPMAKPKKPPHEKKKPRLLVPAIIAGAVAALAALICLIVLVSTVRVGGQRFGKGADEVELSSVTLTAKDMQSLSKMKKIRTLTLSTCDLSACDLSMLNTEKWGYVTLDDCGLTDEQLTKINWEAAASLSEIDLSNNESLTTLQPLSAVADTLTVCRVDNTAITSLAIGASWERLETLSADQTELTSLSGLGSAIYLKNLSAQDTSLTSLDGLENTTLLTRVNIRGNAVSDISYLTFSKEHMRELDVSDTAVWNLDIIRTLEGLTTLYIDGFGVDSLAPLAKCPSLKRLSASYNAITSVDGLQAMTWEYLDLSCNPLVITAEDRLTFSLYADVNLAHTAEIHTVWLGGQTLGFLDMQGAALVSGDGFSQSDVSKLVLSYPSLVDASQLADLPSSSEIFLLDCPLNEQIAADQAVSSIHLTFATANEVADLWEKETAQ